jgi:hypothetical protein
MNFELGTRLNDEGAQVPAYGFTHDGVFVTDPRVSDCGRFAVEPSHYGLTSHEAIRLDALNAGLAEKQASSAWQTLKDSITSEWACRIAEEIDESILSWEADSHCGTETLRIIRLAEFVAAEWPDAREDVYTAAIHQISVVCVG